MTPQTQSRTANVNRYLETSLATANPGALLVMLYDRLVLDLKRAESADRAGDRQSAHSNLLHAQDIVVELQASLDVDVWEGGPGLSSLYSWLRQELIAANIGADADRTASARTVVVEPLADAWRQAALEVIQSGAQGASGATS